MYESHWGLDARPFENRFQSEFYYPSEAHQAALLKLRYAIENRRSAAALCGQSGMGKSLLIHSLRQQLGEQDVAIAHLVYPVLEPEQLIRTIATRLGCTTDAQACDMGLALEAIEKTLQERLSNQQQSVLVIDEAHLLEQHGLLEPLRLLLNIASGCEEAESALTIIFCGQATLLPHLQRNPALEERLAVRCVMPRFSLDETIAYIGHRIRAGGGQVESIFETPSLEMVYSLTQGIPRRINRLCDLALMIGYAQEARKIDTVLLENVHHELAVPSLVD